LESLRLKNRERLAIQQLQTLRRQNDLANLLLAFLETVRETFKSNVVVLSLKPLEAGLAPLYLEGGQIPEREKPVVHTLIESIFASGQPMLVADMGNQNGGRNSLRSVLAAPVGYEGERVVGVLLTGNFRPQSFNSRQMALIRSFSEQVNLVVRNVKLMAEVELKATLAERSRLAREIHDGLAQTLGFLKLQTAQMQNFLNAGKMSRVEESLAASYKVLSEAYMDARQAIEGLRISPGDGELMEWLGQTVLEFQENTDITVFLESGCDMAQLRPEVQSQLIRIVQEALSNIRKHASARHAWIACSTGAKEFYLEVKDDGCGFNIDDIPTAARYGLRGMRERSELIGANLDVVSRTDGGTSVRICYPLPAAEAEI
jgi:two-component system nitrate/nitrite sensor histidine kinase NarX